MVRRVVPWVVGRTGVREGRVFLRRAGRCNTVVTELAWESVGEAQDGMRRGLALREVRGRCRAATGRVGRRCDGNVDRAGSSACTMPSVILQGVISRVEHSGVHLAGVYVVTEWRGEHVRESRIAGRVAERRVGNGALLPSLRPRLPACHARAVGDRAHGRLAPGAPTRRYANPPMRSGRPVRPAGT